MCCKCVDLTGESIDDELYMNGRYSFDSLLDDMVTVLVLDTSKNMVGELRDQRGLLICQDMFESLRGLV